MAANLATFEAKSYCLKYRGVHAFHRIHIAHAVLVRPFVHPLP
jgi:hypothetical protein